MYNYYKQLFHKITRTVNSIMIMIAKIKEFIKIYN